VGATAKRGSKLVGVTAKRGGKLVGVTAKRSGKLMGVTAKRGGKFSGGFRRNHEMYNDDGFGDEDIDPPSLVFTWTAFHLTLKRIVRWTLSVATRATGCFKCMSQNTCARSICGCECVCVCVCVFT
jgi:hypothetical protein